MCKELELFDVVKVHDGDKYHYYTNNEDDNRRKFIADNMQYIGEMDFKDIYNNVIRNKIQLVNDIYMEDIKGGNFRVHIADRRYIVLGSTNRNFTYEDIQNRWLKTVESLGVSMEEFRFYHRYYNYIVRCSPDYYFKWDGVKLTIEDHATGNEEDMIKFFLLMNDGNNNRWGNFEEEFKKIYCDNFNKDIKNVQYCPSGFMSSIGGKFEIMGLKIKAYKNGKMIIDGITQKMLDGYKYYKDIENRLLKNPLPDFDKMDKMEDNKRYNKWVMDWNKEHSTDKKELIDVEDV